MVGRSITVVTRLVKGLNLPRRASADHPELSCGVCLINAGLYAKEIAMTRVVTLLILLLSVLPVRAEEPMTLSRLEEIVRALDADAEVNARAMALTIEDIPVIIVHDAGMNRMRAMTAIRSASSIGPDELMRMMQANFDSALDARYAIAKGRLWSVFIHPLRELQKDEFIEGLGQVVNLALTYGSTYNSGALTFGGGDSNQLHRELIEKLLKKGEDI